MTAKFSANGGQDFSFPQVRSLLSHFVIYADSSHTFPGGQPSPLIFPPLQALSTTYLVPKTSL